MTRRAAIATFAALDAWAFPQSPSGDGKSPSATAATNGQAWEILRSGLDDSDPDHRKKAIDAIGNIGADPDAVHLVERGLRDKDILVRQKAAATLGAMGSKDAIPPLKSALEDSPEVSFSAAKALWELGDTSARWIFQQVIEGERKDTPGRMQSALRDAKHKLRPSQLALMGAKEAAGMLGPASMGIDAIQEALTENKKNNGAPGRVVAAGVLAKDPDPYALTLLEWALGDDSSAVRVAVAKALAERGNQDTIPKLERLMSGDHHAVRCMAAAAVIKIGARPSLSGRSLK